MSSPDVGFDRQVCVKEIRVVVCRVLFGRNKRDHTPGIDRRVASHKAVHVLRTQGQFHEKERVALVARTDVSAMRAFGRDEKYIGITCTGLQEKHIGLNPTRQYYRVQRVLNILRTPI